MCKLDKVVVQTPYVSYANVVLNTEKMTSSQFNRLIIIGNGFDLAHNLDSGTNSFIRYYLAESVNEFYRTGKYSDPLLELKFANDYYTSFSNSKPMTNSEKVIDEIALILRNEELSFKITSLFFQNVYNKMLNLNWVDLEVEFFNALIKTKKVYLNKDQQGAIKNVNKQLEFLKSKLIQYLIKQENEYKAPSDISLLTKCFCEKIKKDEIVTENLKDDIAPNSLYFLNFNYTRILADYVQACNENIPSHINHIHGSLKGEHGNPIFGFGDELDERFKEFEKGRNNELYKHIKSFEYLQTKNFYSLTRLIESNAFQVHIYGHSCGITDRTLLNQIFENKNCKSVKIFYFEKSNKDNDFTEKTYEIYRHFKDKVSLRKKLIPYEMSRAMPQPKF